MRAYSPAVITKVEETGMIAMIAAFRSRAESLEFLDILRRYGVPCSAVNTPREAHVGCGISVKFPPNALGMVRMALARSRMASFAGFFEVDKRYGRTTVRPV